MIVPGRRPYCKLATTTQPVARYVDGRFGACLMVGVESEADEHFESTSDVYAFRRLPEGRWQESDSSGGSSWVTSSRSRPDPRRATDMARRRRPLVR
jgi:hypothetical protein